MEMMLAHAYVAVVPPSALTATVPADLEAVVVRGLSKKPEDRYATAEALDRALAACADAGKWSEEQAAAWWAAGPHGDTVSQEAAALNTPRTA
jgi:serine/threonine-protein kinase